MSEAVDQYILDVVTIGSFGWIKTLSIPLQKDTSGWETNSICKSYAQQIVTIEDLPINYDLGKLEASEAEIFFSEIDVAGIHHITMIPWSSP